MIGPNCRRHSVSEQRQNIGRLFKQHQRRVDPSKRWRRLRPLDIKREDGAAHREGRDFPKTRSKSLHHFERDPHHGQRNAGSQHQVRQFSLNDPIKAVSASCLI